MATRWSGVSPPVESPRETSTVTGTPVTGWSLSLNTSQ
jgi:hypothetical protein